MTLIRKPKNPIELNSVVAALLDRDINAECMLYFRTSCLSVESQEPIAWTLDGEFGGSRPVNQVENRQKALQVILGR